MNVFLQLWNQFNKAILNSPLHWITSRNILLIRIKGRKTGKEFTTPVNFSQAGDTIRITSFSNRSWWQNLKTNPEVVITLRGQEINGAAEVFVDQHEVAVELGAFLESIPVMARYFKVATLPDGSFNQDDLYQSAKGRVMIKVQLKGLSKV